jgi:hypothetical protein
MAHGHSHGMGRSHTHLSQLASTDDNENDEAYPPPAIATRRPSHSSDQKNTSLNMRGVCTKLIK